MGPVEGNSGLASDLGGRIQRFRQSEARSLRTGAKVIGCLGSMVPLELVRACGGRAVRLLEAGRPEDFEAAAELMGADTCPFCRCQIGRCLGGLAPQANLAMLVAASQCDQVRRTAQLFQQHFSVPLLPVMVPAAWQDASSLQMYLGELRWLAAELRELTGVPPSQSRLEESIAAYATARRTIAGLVDQLGSHPLLGHALVCLLGLADPVRLADFAGQIGPQVEFLVQQDLSLEAKPVVLLLGSIMGHEDTLLLSALETRCRVIQATCSGRMFVDLRIPRQSTDPIDALGRACWQQMPSVRSRPNSPFYQYANEMVRRHQVDAIIYRSLKFCDLWGLEAARFKEQMSVPVLVMDCTYGPGQVSLIDSRVQTLLEILQKAGP